MSKFQRLARLAAGALLATGVFASAAAAPASAATDTSSNHKVVMLDTGWGG
ncbi:hypothetical protein [Nocardioides pocheonensis]|jgi:hypothetical protein|uniref:hypothetical protein n=1 Tax=Nocardioides pocheonensis TaxID=661485 RepID=UPI00161FF380|nr:hypothetical protein [Nocardioides pocheonensis]